MPMRKDRPLTGRQALRSPVFWLLLVGCIAALAGVEVWVVVPMLVAGLSISSLPKYIAMKKGMTSGVLTGGKTN